MFSVISVLGTRLFILRTGVFIGLFGEHAENRFLANAPNEYLNQACARRSLNCGGGGDNQMDF